MSSDHYTTSDFEQIFEENDYSSFYSIELEDGTILEDEYLKEVIEEEATHLRRIEGYFTDEDIDMQEALSDDPAWYTPQGGVFEIESLW